MRLSLVRYLIVGTKMAITLVDLADDNTVPCRVAAYAGGWKILYYRLPGSL